MKTFNFDTQEDFKTHIQKSILGYDVIQEIILNLAGFFYNEEKNIYDLGCSEGNTLKMLHDAGFRGLIGLDLSKEMIEKSRKLGREITFEVADIRFYKYENVGIAILVFILQFLEDVDKEIVLKKLHQASARSSAIFVFEKLYSKNGFFQDILTFGYYTFKRKHFTDKELLDKEYSLRPMFRLKTLQEYQKLFEKIGFEYEIIFKSFNFVGFLLRKK